MILVFRVTKENFYPALSTLYDLILHLELMYYCDQVSSHYPTAGCILHGLHLVFCVQPSSWELACCWVYYHWSRSSSSSTIEDVVSTYPDSEAGLPVRMQHIPALGISLVARLA